MRPARPLVAGALALGLAAVAAPALAATPPTPTTTFTNDVLPKLSTLPDLGPTAGTRQVQIGISLAHPDEAGEAAAYRAIYDPASPQYHHFLTPAAFTARFGVPQAQFDATKAWATSTGLTVAHSSTARDYLLLQGDASAAERLLDVSLHDYRLAGGKRVYANTAGPTVPASLGVAGVTGLTDALGMSIPAHTPTVQQDSCVPVAGCTGLTTPQDLWSIYDQPDSNRGSGQKMAIFGEGVTDPVIKDLRQFEAARGLPKMPVNIVSVGDDFTSNDGTEEWDIDTQASTGMAPDAYNETLYFGKDLTDPAVEAVFEAWAGDPKGPLQASASYGECEEAPVVGGVSAPVGTASDMFTKQAEETLRQATLSGKTLFSSSGDQGGSCYYGVGLNGILNNGVPLVSYPASSPYAVSVGGTVLYGDGADQPKRSQEYAWTFTGGGQSSFIAMPDYQKGIATSVGVSAAQPTCISSPDGSAGNTGLPCRVVPDVAAQSGDVATNGYAIVANGADGSPGGGTSLSSPLWLGMWTRLQAAAPKTKGVGYVGLGFANEVLYPQASKVQGDFFDVTEGSNGQYQAFPATPADPTGYDAVSGLGVPDVATLMQHLDGRLTPSRPLTQPVAKDHFAACPEGGVITDPEGDATSVAGLADVPVNDPGLDITSVFLTVDRTTHTLTYHVKVADLSGALYPQQYFRDYFVYEGRQFYLNPEHDLDADSYSLVEQGSVTAGSTTLASDLTGAFDTATSEVTINLPIAEFNSVAHPTVPLGAKSVLAGLDVLAQRPTSVEGSPGATLTADEANGNGCPYTLPKRV